MDVDEKDALEATLKLDLQLACYLQRMHNGERRKKGRRKTDWRAGLGMRYEE